MGTGLGNRLGGCRDLLQEIQSLNKWPRFNASWLLRAADRIPPQKVRGERYVLLSCGHAERFGDEQKFTARELPPSLSTQEVRPLQPVFKEPDGGNTLKYNYYGSEKKINQLAKEATAVSLIPFTSNL